LYVSSTCIFEMFFFLLFCYPICHEVCFYRIQVYCSYPVVQMGSLILVLYYLHDPHGSHYSVYYSKL
jgi:hypothetical protein